MRLGVLVSGRGSNLEAVLDAVADGRLPDVEPVLVVSNRPAARGLEVAAAHGVRAVVLRRADHGGGVGRDRAIGRALSESGVDLALLAGYDQLLHRSFFEAFAGRAINIHPSLLPRHGGTGMTGLAVHEAVLAAGDAETGVTIHQVTAELDAGPVLRQERVPVVPGETAEELATRVLTVEHRVLVETLRDLAVAADLEHASASMTAGSAPLAGPGDSQQRSLPHA
ncbi:MAG TPA: phosphoribosylglycinamide formyltransferase [Candidatus Limnocylindria bacterium]|nr:phosphoribosylglycinamide formyltransferase [Candidatus Limnocylindria bacterium]